MAELTIDPTTIRKALDEFVESYKPSDTPTQEVGYVATAGDGIAHVTGLPGCMANELLTFEDGTLGLAFNLDAREIGVVILGDFTGIEEGQEVRRTGEVLSVPVGDGYLGRVVDPLGNPIDGLGEIKTEGRRILEAQAPDVMHRHPVDEPLSTGLKAIDAMTPIGRGQRQLIIGDRQTGKTAIAIDTIINQKRNWESGDPKKQVRCIYVAVGQKGSTIASVKQSLEEAGAMEYTTIVASPASDSAGFKYIAPYTGSAIGQHWMYNGKHVLIVFDDLSKQAEAYRSISLLLRRPPGREAYPGDVFYLQVLDETLAYQVDAIHTVLPYDTSFLGITEGEDYCTLVTCTPFGINTHRLLVRGTRIPYEEAEVITAEKLQVEDTPASTWEQQYIKGILLGIATVAVILVFCIWGSHCQKRRRRRKTRQREQFRPRKRGKYEKA